LDVSTTLALINARNHSALLLFFAQIVGDYHKVPSQSVHCVRVTTT
jgi:hypothetical protein